MHSYHIYYNQQVVGTAELVQEGLYYRVFCRCLLNDPAVYRIILRDNSQEINMGICVPHGRDYVLERKIPVKRLAGGNYVFRVQENEEFNTRGCISLNVDNPNVRISELSKMRYNKSGEITQLLYSL